MCPDLGKEDLPLTSPHHPPVLIISPDSAAVHGTSVSVVRLLIERGAQPTPAESLWGSTLVRACANGSPEVVEVLLDFTDAIVSLRYRKNKRGGGGGALV